MSFDSVVGREDCRVSVGERKGEVDVRGVTQDFGGKDEADESTTGIG